MAEPTPGPWHYIGDEDGDFVVYAGEEFIANIGRVVQAVTLNPKTELVAFDLDQANARLIAAAWELLAALEAFLDDYEYSCHSENTAENARAAIAKARGDQV